MDNIHDNIVASYEVNLKERKLIIRTEYDYENENRCVDILFLDVLAHYFENELSNSIILDIIESDVQRFLGDNRNMLMQRKNSCWPVDYDTVEQLSETLQADKYSYYVIQSSYGLRGWVLARQFETISINQR